MAVGKQTAYAVGRYGLARDKYSVPLGMDWLREASNLVMNDEGYMSARYGEAKTHGSALDGTDDVQSIFEYIVGDGTSRTVYATIDRLWEDTATPANRTGALAPTAGHWKFLNFNGKVLGWQASHTPIVKTGAGNFAAISAASGTLPDGNAACAAFGRVWAVDDDKQTIRYCALLDETRWATADGGGSIDMRSVWTQGMDEVVAIEAFGSNLVVFGKRHVILWTDGSGSQLGLDPDNMYVTDSIEGLGAVARDAVVLAGERDVVFLSQFGLRSLSRTIQERATPANSLSPSNVRYLADETALASSVTGIKMTYVPQKDWVLLSIPGRTSFLLDLRHPTPDNGYVLTTWATTYTALCGLQSGTLLFGQADSFVYSYGSSETVAGGAYDAIMLTSWVPVGEPGQVGLFKAAVLKMKVHYAQQASIKWAADMSEDFINDNDAVEITFGNSTGDPDVHQLSVPLRGKGEFFSFYIVMDNVNADAGNAFVAFHDLSLIYKPVRTGYGT